MPIYEYRCKKCGKQFEYMQRMSEGPKRKCESCGATALERLISNTSFQLKGSGWYKDLYSSAKPAAGGDTGASSSEGSSDAGSGSAPAASDKGAAAGGSAAASGATGASEKKPAAKDGKKAKKGS